MIPSYASGFARFAAESERPELWHGFIGAFAPALGCTGAILPDLSRGGRATVVNGSWAVNNFGSAIQFNGSSTLINCNRSVFFGTGDFSYIFALRTGAITSGQYLYHQHRVGGEYHYIFIGTSVIQVKIVFASVFLQSTETLASNTTQTLILTRRGGIGNLWINGINKTNRASSIANDAAVDTGNTILGTYGSTWFDGAINMFTAYNRALVDSEIQETSADPLGMFRLKSDIYNINNNFLQIF
jgi:hypothetical protein